jgi:murein DD-endopeptidase MepM/ murein hydrolase activator NlpD
MQEDQLPETLPDPWGERSLNNSFDDLDAAFAAAPAVAEPVEESRLFLAWQRLSNLGLADSFLRIGTHTLSIAMVLLVVWIMREFYLQAQPSDAPRRAAFAAAAPTATPLPSAPDMPPYQPEPNALLAGIPRLILFHTTIPTRPRTEIVAYTVKKGDTIFGIAEKFGLKPETVLWGNYYVLADNPHALTPDQELNIMPSDGTYHKWSAGEGLNGVAEGYGVSPDVIIDWPGNHLNPETLGNLSDPNIEPGTFLFVPGGERAFVTWSAPRITRDNPGVAKFIGPGSCGTIVDGAVGGGTFIWPSAKNFLSGYDYSPSTNHYGIDIDGDLGEPMWASDGGVIVYAGWNNFGYGYMVVIDHGTGWQTVYAHMSAIGVVCGQSVFQGTPIGSVGSTGKSSGPHIHFEMLHDTYGKVNPWDFLP